MKIYSWNVNGIRAVIKKGVLAPFVAEHQPDILCLQETKVDRATITAWRDTDAPEAYRGLLRQGIAVATPRRKKPAGLGASVSQPSDDGGIDLTAMQGQAEVDMPEYEEYWNSAEKKGYSGTAIFTKPKPLAVINGLPPEVAQKYGLVADAYGDPNGEGRVIAAEYEQFYVVTVYTPNAKDDLTRVGLRHKQWDPAFLAYCKQLEQHKPVVFCGDLNVAHTPDDLANPKPNIGKKGFTHEEREGFQNFIDAGFVDTFRMFHQGNGYYTWWSHFARARERNVGWRIDYILVSAALKSKVVSANIHPEILGSDHCPVSIELAL